MELQRRLQGLQRWIPLWILPMGMTTTSQEAANCSRAAKRAVHAPLKTVLAIRRLRGAAVAAGQGLCVCVRRLLGQAAGLWALHVRALLLGRVPGEALAGGRPQGGMPTAA